jgi:hypothetical protein
MGGGCAITLRQWSKVPRCYWWRGYWSAAPDHATNIAEQLYYVEAGQLRPLAGE